jgi:hypothetical protein
MITNYRKLIEDNKAADTFIIINNKTIKLQYDDLITLNCIKLYFVANSIKDYTVVKHIRYAAAEGEAYESGILEVTNSEKGVLYTFAGMRLFEFNPADYFSEHYLSLGEYESISLDHEIRQQISLALKNNIIVQKVVDFRS